MNATKKQHDWSKFINFYSEQNAGRPTRLGVFERKGKIMSDFWLESGLPLVGIDIDTSLEIPSIQVTVGDLRHDVRAVTQLIFRFGIAGDEDGIDIVSQDGRTTILRFELEPRRT